MPFGSYTISYLGSAGGLAPVTGGPGAVDTNDADVMNSTYIKTTDEGTTATTSITFDNLGFVTYLADSGLAYKWAVNGDPINFSIFFEITGGTLASGNGGVWLNLGTSRTFYIDQVAVGGRNTTGIVRIRRDTDFLEVASGNVNLWAIVQAVDSGGGELPPGGTDPQWQDDRIIV